MRAWLFRSAVLLTLAVMTVSVSADRKAFLGRWNLTTTGDNPAPYWLEVKDEGGTLTAKFLNRGGHPTPASNVRVEGEELLFTFGPPNQTQPPAEFRGKVSAGTLTGTLTRGERTVTLTGRHPA